MSTLTVSPAVQLCGVTLEYPGAPPVKALDCVDLNIDAGEFLAVVGSSGSGKTSLLSVAGGLRRPTAGTVRIANQTAASEADRNRLRACELGFVFQAFHLVGHLTALENVALALRYHPGPQLSLRQSMSALEVVGLGARAGHRPDELSGGEQQRVAIARSLLTRPSILLADEPTGNLDSKTAEGILRLLVDLNSSGTTVVVVTHQSWIADIARRVVVLRDGRVDDDLCRFPHAAG